MRITVLVALVIAGLVCPTVTHAETRREAKLERKVAKLKRDNRRLERSRDRWWTRAIDAKDDLEVLAEGLPGAIRAVPLDQFFALVLQPAMETWPCDTWYQGDSGYWSLDFTNREFCG